MSMYYGYKNGYAVYRRASLDTVSAVSSGSYAGSFLWQGSMGGSFAFGSFALGSFASSGSFGSFAGSGISGSLAASSGGGMPEVILGYGIDLI